MQAQYRGGGTVDGSGYGMKEQFGAASWLIYASNSIVPNTDQTNTAGRVFVMLGPFETVHCQDDALGSLRFLHTVWNSSPVTD